jgi:hypothetical protein
LPCVPFRDNNGGMATQPQPGTPRESVSPETAESISQFAARVLNQLSLVAWLPSGTLVLALTFVLELNSILTGKLSLKAQTMRLASHSKQ